MIREEFYQLVKKRGFKMACVTVLNKRGYRSVNMKSARFAQFCSKMGKWLQASPTRKVRQAVAKRAKELVKNTPIQLELKFK